jgi:hypothetical protein
MSRNKQLEEFERRFDSMSVKELLVWKKYWTTQASLLAPKIQKLAMKRVHKIEKAILIKQREE